MGCYEKVKKWRHNTKYRLIEAFGGECGICGYNKCSECLEFHHLDPLEKEFSSGSYVSWDRVVVEIRKCVMLCSNCHREVHYNTTQIPDNIKRFDESFTTYKTDKLFDNCPICGNLKSASLITCSNACSKKRSVKLDWEKYDLLSLYDSIGSYNGVTTYISKAENIDISDSTIRKRIKRLLAD